MPKSAEPTTTRTLAQKLLGVMERVTYIQKRGKNDFHGYKYATEADVAEAVRAALIAEGVVIIPSLVNRSSRDIVTARGKTETVTSVRMLYTVMDVASGDKLDFEMEGDGQDPGDKGVFKAITGCTKYALMKLFHIPTGDDPEGDTKTDETAAEREAETITQEQADELAAECAEHGRDLAKLCEFFHVETVRDLTLAQYERAKKSLAKRSAA